MLSQSTVAQTVSRNYPKIAYLKQSKYRIINLLLTVFYQRLWQGSCYQQMEGPFASLVPTMKLLSPRASSLHKIISRGTLKLLMGQFGQ